MGLLLQGNIPCQPLPKLSKQARNPTRSEAHPPRPRCIAPQTSPAPVKVKERARKWLRDAAWELQDEILGGEVSCDLSRKELGYVKTLGLAGGAQLELTARCDYRPLLQGQAPSPFIGVAMQSSTDTGPGNLHSRLAQDSSGHILDLETQIPITRSLKLEACGTARIPLPAAQYSSASGDVALELQEPFHLHLAELNAVMYV